MRCYYHPDRDIVVTCTDCGKGLCKECADRWEPPVCRDCAAQRTAVMKENNKKTIIVSLVLLAAGIIVGIITAFTGEGIKGVASGLVYGYMLASVCSGWRALTKIQPSMFLFLPLIGWVIYFFVKFILSIFVGLFMFPVTLYRYWKNNKDIKNLENSLH